MRKLGEILVHEGLVTPDHVDRALVWQRDDGGRLGSLLIRLGYVEEREFLRLMAAHLRTRPILIREQSLDPALIAMVPAAAARQANAVPIALHADHLIVATCDPLNVRALREIEALTGRTVEPWLAADPAIAAVLDRFYPRYMTAEVVVGASTECPSTRLEQADPRVSLEALIDGWIGRALDLGACTLAIQMTPAGLRVRAEAPAGGVTIAEPHASLYRELLRRLRQATGLRAAVTAGRRETAVLRYVRDGARLRLSLTFAPDDFGCSVRVNLDEARGRLAELTRFRRHDDLPGDVERLAS